MQNNIVLHGELARKGMGAFMDKDRQPTPYPAVRTWFVLINSERALFYRRHHRDLEFMGGATPHIAYEKEEGNRSFGRIRAGMNSTVRHSFSPSDASARHEEFLFLCSLSDYLDEACDRDAFDELVLIAAPETLGMLHGILSDRLEERVRMELSRDLINMPAPQIRQAIEKEMYI